MTEAQSSSRTSARPSASKVVLNGVDLAVQRGQSLVVIGGSGTGKSVMIKCMLGIIQPDSGSIRVGGEEVTRPARRAARQGAVALRHAVPGRRRCSTACRSGRTSPSASSRARSMRRARGPRDRHRASSARWGSGPRSAMLSPAELSGGMQKRVGLARAIAADPEIIFFDEPTTGLDPIMADVINDLIVDCVKRPRRHHDLDHPRHGVGAQDRRRHRHDLQGQDHLAGPGKPKSTTAATPMSSSSSTAAPRARSRWKCSGPEPTPRRHLLL